MAGQGSKRPRSSRINYSNGNVVESAVISFPIDPSGNVPEGWPDGWPWPLPEDWWLDYWPDLMIGMGDWPYNPPPNFPPGEDWWPDEGDQGRWPEKPPPWQPKPPIIPPIRERDKIVQNPAVTICKKCGGTFEQPNMCRLDDGRDFNATTFFYNNIRECKV